VEKSESIIDAQESSTGLSMELQFGQISLLSKGSLCRFDSSVKRGDFATKIGVGQVIKGENGIA
jgi:hypothetical protein